MPIAVSIATLLAGCGLSAETNFQLPPAPADIQACFRRAAVAIPDRALSVADVESLWKRDRVRGVVMAQCGQRFLAWYEDIRKGK
jgi:hypothetical protein